MSKQHPPAIQRRTVLAGTLAGPAALMLGPTPTAAAVTVAQAAAVVRKHLDQEA
jgi:hypothetical protein